MNGSYDFSTVASNGEITYTERSIKIVLGLPATTKEQLYSIYSKTLEWLMGVGKSQLVFDDIFDYYFMAEVECASTFDEVLTFGNLEVEFIAEPFKQGACLVGDEAWDTFNFDEDVIQDVEFDVVTTKTITLYNPGRPVTPLINSIPAMSIVKDWLTYDLKLGDNKPYNFKLQNGSNTLTINGTGHIIFTFRKVSL
jgi:predicted phage tail component-like protein